MKPQIPDKPVAAPSLPCIPWFQQKPQTTQNTRKAQQTFSFSVAFSFCALCAFLWLISFRLCVRVRPLWSIIRVYPCASVVPLLRVSLSQSAPICVNLRLHSSSVSFLVFLASWRFNPIRIHPVVPLVFNTLSRFLNFKCRFRAFSPLTGFPCSDRIRVLDIGA